MNQRALEGYEMALGREHPSTLTSMDNLATIWKYQECNDEALKLMVECVQLRKKILGVEHPATLSSLNKLNKWEKERSFHIMEFSIQIPVYKAHGRWLRFQVYF